MAHLVLLIAVLSRVWPRLAHTTGGNVTAVEASLLFFGLFFLLPLTKRIPGTANALFRAA